MLVPTCANNPLRASLAFFFISSGGWGFLQADSDDEGGSSESESGSEFEDAEEAEGEVYSEEDDSGGSSFDSHASDDEGDGSDFDDDEEGEDWDELEKKVSLLKFFELELELETDGLEHTGNAHHL